MNKHQKKIARSTKRLQQETGCKYGRCRRVTKECYRFIKEIKKLEEKDKQKLKIFYGE